MDDGCDDGDGRWPMRANEKWQKRRTQHPHSEVPLQYNTYCRALSSRMYGRQGRGCSLLGCCSLLVLIVFRFQPGSSWITWSGGGGGGIDRSSSWRRQRRQQLGSAVESASLLNEENSITSSTTPAVVAEETPLHPRLRELYPPSEAYANGYLKVDSLHSIYYEVHGNNNNSSSSSRNGKHKKSALFLHGGPGAGCNPTHARFFNPDVYDTIVLLDQRGSGRSTPRAMVYNNTILDLIYDCEALRRHLQISAWDVVLGGSFGTTLAMSYVQEYPSSIKSLILRGVCLMRPAEIEWLFTPQGGAARRNPQAWQNFANTIIGSNSDDDVVAGNNKQTIVNVGTDDGDEKSNYNIPNDRTVLHQYYDDMFGTNATRRWNAARGWMTWEFTVSASFKRRQEETASNTTTNDIPNSPAVLVSLPAGSSGSTNWEYQDHRARRISEQDRIRLGLEDPAEIASVKCRQGLPHSSSSALRDGQSLARPRPIAMMSADFVTAQAKAQQKDDGNFNGLPALAMLTCFYSVNENYAMHDWNLLSPERMARIRRGHHHNTTTSIPCIAIQGGRDPICPPDTALDVKEQWPEMELRIPLLAGHSMYHPEIVHELVQATDRIVFLT
jgi:pimeloyl-ACP methyl ester carboxylesterase